MFALIPFPGGAPAPGFEIRGFFPPALRFESFGQLASDIVLILTTVAAVLSVFFIMIAGFKFVTSGGDEKKLASARNTITYAIIGIAVTILAFIILRVIQYILGANVKIT